MSGFPGDIPANAITWKVITMPAESLHSLKAFWNTQGLSPAGSFFSWVSSSEANRFARLASEITSKVKELGSNKHFGNRLATKSQSHKEKM